MKISTRGRYGTRAMFDLALHQGQGPQPLKAIAARQEISEQYLEQLLGTLRLKGLVRSVRGAQGGYEIADDPKVITIGAVLRALEGPVAVAKCLEADQSCGRMECCTSRRIWKRLNDSINQVIDTISLADMLDDYHGACLEEQ